MGILTVDQIRDMSFTAELRLQDGSPLTFLQRDGRSEPLEGSFMVAKKDGEPTLLHFRLVDEGSKPMRYSVTDMTGLGLRLVDGGVRLDKYEGWHLFIRISSDLAFPRAGRLDDLDKEEQDIYLWAVGREHYFKASSSIGVGEGGRWINVDSKSRGGSFTVPKKDDELKVAREKYDKRVEGNKKILEFLEGALAAAKENADDADDADDAGVYVYDEIYLMEPSGEIDECEADFDSVVNDDARLREMCKRYVGLESSVVSDIVNHYRELSLEIFHDTENVYPAALLKLRVVKRHVLLADVKLG